MSRKPRKKTLEEMIYELSHLLVAGIIQLDLQIAQFDFMRIGGPKPEKQKGLEKEREEKATLFEKMKDEIAERLGVKDVTAGMKMRDFYDFLLINFHVEKDKISRRENLLMPFQITDEILKKAAREVGRRMRKRSQK